MNTSISTLKNWDCIALDDPVPYNAERDSRAYIYAFRPKSAWACWDCVSLGGHAGVLRGVEARLRTMFGAAAGPLDLFHA